MAMEQYQGSAVLRLTVKKVTTEDNFQVFRRLALSVGMIFQSFNPVPAHDGGRETSCSRQLLS